MNHPAATAPTPAGTAPRPPHPQTTHSDGLVHHLWGWIEAMLHHASLRLQLALMEAKEAGSHYGMIAGLFAAAAIVALFAYVFVILTVVLALAAWMDEPNAWLKIMSGAAGLHVVLAFILVLMAKSRLKAGVFEKTKEEFTKDKPWPHPQTHPGAPKT